MIHRDRFHAEALRAMMTSFPNLAGAKEHHAGG
jgi:hypothetical protein